MKKRFVLPVLALFVIISIIMISAVPITTVEFTRVSGVITDATKGNAPVSGAEVIVTCNGNEINTTSDVNGNYSVVYPLLCYTGDSVSVSATYGSLSGSNNNAAWNTEIYLDNSTSSCLELIFNVALINVPLIPEFGLLIGSLTLLSAVGIFFLVRRK